MLMPKHEQKSHLGIDLGARVNPLPCISMTVDKLEEAACFAKVAPPSLLANPALPGVLFPVKVLLPLPITLDSTSTTLNS